MTRWAVFAGITLTALVLLLLLARASQSVVGGRYVTRDEQRWLDRLPDGADHLDTGAAPEPDRKTPAETTLDSGQELTTTALLANVAVSHGLFAALLVGGALMADVPASAFGITADPIGSGLFGVGVGIAVGIAISLANTLAAGLVDIFDSDPSEELREMLAPETARGWVLLLGGVLPLIAGFEELLFRGALIGAMAVGFGVSPWLLAVLSSIAFAAGHGAQGGLGIVVTGLLGFALAAVFVLTNSLLVVVVAHYVVNAVEFVVVEGLGWEPFGG
ncbi:CPBP family intramembrane metalloprotease [Natronomonas halophila]|uniref:CPBP family intramembrane glutamic endopeptidase n=1 Tax=Natronomonas halophila TaxID=2747817 RepID=UPI0015B73FBA|nr:CPBP family intramembrane glutamic endopeptidase [Natronomonas halophila]QLD86430.1 CPBP family intramembrane metalloprotease [Natronomonas halophila]